MGTMQTSYRKKKVGFMWIYTIKYKYDGSIEIYKVRLIAKGYTHTYRIDYSDTFSYVAKIDTIWVILSVVTNKLRLVSPLIRC